MSSHCGRYPKCNCPKEMGTKCHLPEGHPYLTETPEETEARVKLLMETMEIIESGYAGILPNGNIVDRRQHPEAVPCQENPLFNTPKPKNL